jgi:hypothetical protein
VFDTDGTRSSRLLFTRLCDNLAVGDHVHRRTQFVLDRSADSQVRISAIQPNVPLFGHVIKYVEFDNDATSAELVLVPVHTKHSIRNSKCRVNEVGELVAAEDGRMITRMAYPKYNYT